MIKTLREWPWNAQISLPLYMDKKSLAERDMCSKFIARIVAEVDQLMALCEPLKSQLSQALQLNQHVVEQTVA